MFTLPAPPPSWDGFHPLVVHFPIGLLMVAPLFVVLGALTGARNFMLAALLLLVLGTAAAFVATNTGEAAYDVYEPDEASELLDPDYEYDEVATEHGELAELARNLYAGITAAYAVWVLLAFVKPSTLKLQARFGGGVVFLILFAVASLPLANAGHLGGELVHRYGMRAAIATAEEEAEEDDAEEDDDAEEGDAGEATDPEAADE